MAPTPFPSDGKYWLEKDIWTDGLAIKYKKAIKSVPYFKNTITTLVINLV